MSHPVHHALPDVAHAGLADAAVRNDWTFVGYDRVAFHVNSGRTVSIRQVIELVSKMNCQRADGAADIVIFFKAQTEYGPVVLDRSFGFELLRAGVSAGHHMLAAVFEPFHWPPGFHGEQRNQNDILADQMNLLAKTSSDIGNDHSNILQSQGFAQSVVDHLRHLGGHPNG